VSTTELVIVFIASCVGMFVKSVVGMGYPLFAVPLLSLKVGVETAVVVVSAPNLIANTTLCYRARSGARETRDLPVLAATALIGALIGTVLLVSLPEQPLLLALVATIAVFVVQYLRAPGFALSPSTSRRWSPVAGGVIGLMQGGIGVAGPAMAVWLYGYRLRRDAYVFSITGLLILGGIAQVTYLVVDGEYGRDRMVGSAVALLAVVLMVPIGARVRYRLSGPAFERFVLLVLVVAALALLGRAFA
jgi:uncharacterized membrane protein YfcA